MKSYELEIEEKLTGTFDVCKVVSKKNAAILFCNNKGENLIEWMIPKGSNFSYMHLPLPPSHLNLLKLSFPLTAPLMIVTLDIKF